jgi:hypothetical protein
MIRMSLALLVFVQHNVLLATSFKKLKGEWRKNSYIALTFMGSLLVGTCTVKKKKKKKKNLNMPDLGVIDELDSTKERNKSFS